MCCPEISSKPVATAAPGSGDGVSIRNGAGFDLDEEGNLYLILGAGTDIRWNPGTMTIGNLDVPVPSAAAVSVGADT